MSMKNESSSVDQEQAPLAQDTRPYTAGGPISNMKYPGPGTPCRPFDEAIALLDRGYTEARNAHDRAVADDRYEDARTWKERMRSVSRGLRILQTVQELTAKE
jgi:hypothetical protein